MATNTPLDAIDWGSRITGGKVIEVFFVPAGRSVRDSWGDSYTSDGFNGYEVGQFTRAFNLIERSVDLDFQRVYSRADADFVIGFDSDGELGRQTLGWMMPAGEKNAGRGMFNTKQWDRAPGGDLEVGGYAFVTIVHEILHGLGLAHPFDKGGTSTKFPGLSRWDVYDLGPDLLNQGVFTTMSYGSGFQAGPVGTSAEDRGYMTKGYEIGPSPLDIALLQEKYGANATARSGDTTYTLPDTNALQTGYRTIWDTSGTDKIAYVGDRDVTINLLAATLEYEKGGGGFVSGARGVAGGFTIAAGVVIENASSAAGDDKLVGNQADNLLVSRGGRDTLLGRAGDDRLFGGPGRDEANGGSGQDAVNGKGGPDVLNGGAGDDAIRGGRGQDRLIGDVGGDRLNGGRANDVVRGGGGEDTIRGGRGADKLYGGADGDRFLFSKGDGRDRIFSFDVTEDRIGFDPSLWGGHMPSAGEIVAGAVVTDLGVVFRFGGGDAVTLVGLFDTAGLEAVLIV